MFTLRYYVLRELFGPVLLSALFFTFILLVLRLFALADQLLRAGVSLGVLGQLTLIILGTVFTLTIPMAFLLGILVAVGRLTSENEVLAMRAAGLSVFKVFLPVLGTGLLLAGALMFANNEIVPRLLNRIDEIRYDVQFDLLTSLQPQRFYSDLGQSDIETTRYYRERGTPPAGASTDPDKRQLHMTGVSMRFKAERGAFMAADAERARMLTPQERAELNSDEEFLVFARTGIIEGDREQGELRIILHDGTLLPIGGEIGDRSVRVHFGEMRQVLSGGDETTMEIRMVTDKELGFAGLLARVNEPPDGPAFRTEDGAPVLRGVWRDWYATRNEFIQRFTLPLATFAFAMVAVPLAIEIRPRAKAFSFLIAVVLMAVYYGMFTFMGKLASAGVGDTQAWLLLLAPDVVLAIVGALLFRRAMWR